MRSVRGDIVAVAAVRQTHRIGQIGLGAALRCVERESPDYSRKHRGAVLRRAISVLSDTATPAAPRAHPRHAACTAPSRSP